MTGRKWLVVIAEFVRRRLIVPGLMIGLILRLVGLESRSLQYDDVFSIFLSRRSLAGILRGTAADTMPPFYYFVLHYWLAVSQQVWFIRLLSVLISLFVIILIYQLGKQWFGQVPAAWAAFLAALSPLMIYHAQDVRMYALLVLTQLGYLWFFTLIWQQSDCGKPAMWSWLGLVLCGMAAMYSHNVAIFMLIVPNIFLLLRRRWILFWRLVLAQAVIGMLALPWLLLLPVQIAKVQKAWTLPQPGLVEILQAAVMFTSSLPLPIPLLALALLFTLQIIVMVGLELWRNLRWSPDDRPGVILYLVLLLVPPFLLFAVSYIVKPVFIPRAFLISSLAFDLLAGLVIARTWSRGVGKIMAVAFLLAAAISLPSYYTYDVFPRSPYRAAMISIEKVVRPGERIIHETKLSYFPSAFYSPDLPQVFLADIPGSANDTFERGSQQAMQIFPEADLDTAAGSGCPQCTGVYFITFTQTLHEYKELGLNENPNLLWLEDHYRFVERHVFSDLEVYYYVR